VKEDKWMSNVARLPLFPKTVLEGSTCIACEISRRSITVASVYWHRVGGDELDEHRHKAGRCNPDRTHLSAVRRRERLAGSYLERRAQHHKSFVLTMIDIDVKPDKWSHWVVVGLPATVKSLPRGATSLPGSAKAIVSNFGDAAYSGPCPPKGTGVHREGDGTH
jgi:hypothetical protein